MIKNLERNSNTFKGILFGLALLVAGNVAVRSLSSGPKQQFDNALREKVVMCQEYNKNRVVTNKETEQYFQEFLKLHELYIIQGQEGVYDTDGKKISYSKLSELL